MTPIGINHIDGPWRESVFSIEKVDRVLKLCTNDSQTPEWGVVDGIYIDPNTPYEVARQSPTFRKLRADILGITNDR